MPVIEGGIEEQLNQTIDQTEKSSVLPEITRLTEQLLFTWGHLEEQAHKVSAAIFETKKQQNLLDEMIDEAHRMDDLLQALKRAIKAL